MSLASDKRGAKLQQFIACLGSQRIRLVNRTHQNAIGELTTDLSFDGSRRTILLVEFGEKLTEVASVAAWCKPLFVYGVVVHALVDTLDPTHQSTHPRSSYGNELTKSSKQEIEHLVFGEYLKETGANNQYI